MVGPAQGLVELACSLTELDSRLYPGQGCPGRSPVGQDEAGLWPQNCWPQAGGWKPAVHCCLKRLNSFSSPTGTPAGLLMIVVAFICRGNISWFDSLEGNIPWRRKWQPTPEFLPGKSHGQRSLVGYSPRGHRESDMTERLNGNQRAPAVSSQTFPIVVLRGSPQTFFLSQHEECIKADR